MKCTIPEISWHNREPILSVDIFPENRSFYRLASGGGDCHVLIWQMNITQIGAVNQEVISDLTRHQRAVNCVRWSNTGQYLASGDDDANIIIWQLKTDNIPLLEGETGDREIWTVYKVMRGHKEDVYDLCWSMDGVKILSGSVDNTSILWDVNKGKMDHIMTDHKGFVQGVSWDPKNQIIATISTDRICRIFDPFGKQIKARIQKGKLSVPGTHYFYDKEVKFFHDDTFKSFFRRLQFTPDGSLLIVPSGHFEADSCKNVLNATLIFTLDNFSSPAVILPLPHQSSTVVRCCPMLFQLHENGPDPVVKLPYRMIFAVGTDHDIILYDTQQTVPFARFQDIHYTRLTDLTWSQDGLLLIASSTDGFCSLITFEIDELGVPWTKPESEREDNPLDISGCEELVTKDENVDTNNKGIVVGEKINELKEECKEESKNRPSFLKQWAIQTPKKKKLNLEESRCVKKQVDANEIIEISDSPLKDNLAKIIDFGNNEQKKQDVPINRLIPRRITPLKIADSNKEKSEVLISSDGKSKLSEKVNFLIPRRKEPKLIESMPSTSALKGEQRGLTRKPAELSLSRDINIAKNAQLREEEDDSSDSEAENLSKEELQEFHKASENIREFFCRVPKKQNSHTDIKPIAIRRKPRESPSTGNCEQADGNKSNNTTISTGGKEADAIEIIRKPKDPETNENHLKSEKNNVKDQLVTKPTFGRRKPEIKAEKCKKDKSKKPVSIVKDIDTKSSHDVVVFIDSEIKDYNTTPKKPKLDLKSSKKIVEDGPPKIKVSSLINSRKSVEKTPKKPNALLNFLQKSAEKRKKPKDDKEEIISVIGLAENEARDAWQCDSQEGEQCIKSQDEKNRTASVDDDVTEDFCLQLEDSQEAGDEEQTQSQSSEKKSAKSIESNEIKINLNSRPSDNKSNKESETGSGFRSDAPKTPRRVQLITLVSPKGKTKKELDY